MLFFKLALIKKPSLNYDKYKIRKIETNAERGREREREKIRQPFDVLIGLN